MKKKNIQTLIGQRIRQIREEKKMSQVELADLCQFERSNMSRLEGGNTNPTAYTLFIVANGLGVAVSDLIRVIDTKKSSKKKTTPNIEKEV